MIQALSNNSWFFSLPEGAREQLSKIARTKHYASDQWVHEKNATSDGLYALISGELKVISNTINGDELIFTRLLPGQWFGEIGLLDGKGRTHGSQAVIDSQVIIFPRQAVLELCQLYPLFYSALVELLCEHCRMAFSLIDDFLLCTPEQRMARRLLNLLGKDHNQPVSISQQDLGGLVGVSRQSANKILKNWQGKGWIKRVYRGVRVNSTEALKNLIDK
jgi:CRP-like cAMP-binding protein